MRLPGLKVADKVKKLAEKTDGQADPDAVAALDRLRSHAAIAISVLAALLALASAGADKSVETIIVSNIHATDLWAFYQAKATRQAVHLAAAEALETELAAHTNLDEATKARMRDSIEKRRATAARYDDEPDPAAPDDPLRGDGKKQLMARARSYESLRDRATSQERSFRVSAILLQVAIVLGSVAILAHSRRTLALVLVVGVLGGALLANGYLLLVHL